MGIEGMSEFGYDSLAVAQKGFAQTGLDPFGTFA